MDNIVPDPTQSTAKARSRLAIASRSSVDVDEEGMALLRANMACANIDNKIRHQSVDATLRGVHVGHLVGLLLNNANVDGATSTLIEKLARDAVEAAQNGTAR